MVVEMTCFARYCRTKSRVDLNTQDPVDTPFPHESSHIPMDSLRPPTPLPQRPVKIDTTDPHEPMMGVPPSPFESPTRAKVTPKYKEKDVNGSPGDIQQLLAKRD